MYQYSLRMIPWGLKHVECNSVNKVALKYISALVGFLGKIEKNGISCVYFLCRAFWNRWENCFTSDYSTGSNIVHQNRSVTWSDADKNLWIFAGNMWWPKTGSLEKFHVGIKGFCLGQDDIKDKERSGRLRTSTDNTSEEIIAVILEKDTCTICEEIVMESSCTKVIHSPHIIWGIRKKGDECPLHGILQIFTDCFHPLQVKKFCKFCHYYYEGHLECKERFAIKKYLLIIGKKKNMQVLSHTFTYFST